MPNTIVQKFSDYLTYLQKKVPEYVEWRIKKVSPLFEKLKYERKPETFWLTIPFASPKGVGAFNSDNENASLPYSNRFTFIQPYDNLHEVVATERFTAKMLEEANDDTIIKDLVADKFERVTNVLKETVVKTFYATPYAKSGKYYPVLAVATSTSSQNSSTITLTGKFNLIDINDNVEIYSISSGAIGSLVTNGVCYVSDISTDRKTIKLTSYNGGNISLSANTDYLLLFHDFITYEASINTYKHIASTSRTLHNVNSANYSYWNGVVKTASGGALTVANLRSLITYYRNTSLNFDYAHTEAYTNYEHILALQSDLISLGIFQANITKDLTYGKYNIIVDGVSIIEDPLVHPNELFLPAPEYMSLSYYSEPKWIEVNGEVLFNSPSAPNLYQLALKWKVNYTCTLPMLQARLIDLTHPHYDS